MVMRKWFLVIIALFLSTSANASVIKTLNGVDYEWFEFTETIDLSRDQVELRLTDSNDVLYGYEYASRSLVQSLFLSYSAFDGINGWHGAAHVLHGTSMYLADFGVTNSYSTNPIYNTTTDGFSALVTSRTDINAVYGELGECSTPPYTTCLSMMSMFYTSSGSPAMAYQSRYLGWDATSSTPQSTVSAYSAYNTASFLVRTTPVPVPASIWLFSLGLLGLIRVAKRKI